MKRWFFALAMAAMLGIGFAAGSVLTHARAEGANGNAVEVYVSRLRKKLGASIITTVRAPVRCFRNSV